MYLTEQELRDQFQALRRTAQALRDCREEALAALEKVEGLCVLGCGSSYSLAKSAALQFSLRTGRPGWALPAGDLLVNFDVYKTLLRGAAVLLLSRSGATSEVVRAARRCREELGCPILSICAREGAPVEELTDWDLCIPWAFDSAVCQTRTVTNLYAAALGLACLAAGDDSLPQRLDALADWAQACTPGWEPILSGLAARPWDRAVVLADGGPTGLAEEGALAFKEICRRDSNHYHLLDVRHGPMVQISPSTLVIALLSPGDRALQADLLADVAARTEHLLVLDCGLKGDGLPGQRIALPDCGGWDVQAVLGLYCIQVLCLRHAEVRGVDPDQPEGLDPWIKL